MALGFGFNKAKILSVAEKCVQQGKLQAAIAEYDKIVKQDPKDLTVLNTIGDLYARVGNNSQAVGYFKQVGDAYATAGFIVKAIAMFKKVTKLSPHDIESVVRLADLYSQQGLYSDARSQYMVLADQYMKTGQNDSAAGIFKKMLELDPENTGMQTRLADIYLKLGKKDDAKSIFFKAAESLHARGSLDAADEALDRVLKIDPRSSEALILRAQVATESNKPEKASACLEKISDIDSRPEALNALLNALLQSGRIEDADPIISKLLNVHNDANGLKPYAEALLSQGHFEDALKLYGRHADRLIAADSEGFIKSLQTAVGKVGENPRALELVLTLFRKAGATTYINEVLELLAHAYAQSGQLEKASKLYEELSQLEPDNPTHAQSLKQIVARMGTDPAARELTPEESSQAFMVEELQHSAPVLKTNYPKEIADAVRAALTDSELFSSYNLPEKAIGPLEAALPGAPQDPQLHQQLATLYVRSGRFQDAANSCKILSRLYAEAGHQEQANQYAGMAAKYEDQAGEQPATAPQISRLSTPGIEVELKAEPSEPAFSASSVAEFAFEENQPAEAAQSAPAETPIAEVIPEIPVVPAAEVGQVREVEIPRSISSSQIRAYTDPVMEPPVAETVPPQEVDLSGEWEEMLVVEEAPPQPVSIAPEPVSKPTAEAVPAAREKSQTTETAPAAPELQVIPAPPAEGPVPAMANEVAETIEELRFYLDQSMAHEAKIALERLISLAADNPAVKKLRSEVDTLLEKQARESAAAKKTAAQPPSKAAKAVPAEFSFELEIEEIPSVPATPPPIPVHEKVMAAEPEVLDLGAQTPAPARVPAPRVTEPMRPAASIQPSVTHSPTVTQNPLGELILDLEEALGSDFGKPAQMPAAITMTAHQTEAVAPQKAVRDEETTSVLSELFEEFKGEVEETESGEDPETHYNLGVAFKEMGLLDEAIGELQKVCHAINNGRQFSQVIQAYTWLAHCLMEKGAPQAAVRWYESALKIPDIAEESRLAVYYDLASAHEASGDRKAALDDLMKVYGSNIDYRDVAERIKVLRA